MKNDGFLRAIILDFYDEIDKRLRTIQARLTALEKHIKIEKPDEEINP